MKNTPTNIDVEYKNGKVILSEQDWQKVVRIMKNDPYNRVYENKKQPVISARMKGRVIFVLTILMALVFVYQIAGR